LNIQRDNLFYNQACKLKLFHIRLERNVKQGISLKESYVNSKKEFINKYKFKMQKKQIKWGEKKNLTNPFQYAELYKQ